MLTYHGELMQRHDKHEFGWYMDLLLVLTILFEPARLSLVDLHNNNSVYWLIDIILCGFICQIGYFFYEMLFRAKSINREFFCSTCIGRSRILVVAIV